MVAPFQGVSCWPMGTIDWEKERQRLANAYSRMEDSELNELARDADSLTDVARQALQTELSHRNLAEVSANSTPTITEKTDNPPPLPVMIRRFRDLPEASLAKSILDSAGIQSFLADDNTVRMDWLWSNVISGVKLWVRAEDVEAAMKLLDQNTPEKFELDDGAEYIQPRCPHCQSMDVTLGGLNKRLSYGSLLVGLPLPVSHEGWKCNSCGNEWKEEHVDANEAESGGAESSREPEN